MTKTEFVVTKLEIGSRLTGATLERPVRSKTKRKAMMALMREIERISKGADAVAVTVQVYGNGGYPD